MNTFVVSTNEIFHPPPDMDETERDKYMTHQSNALSKKGAFYDNNYWRDTTPNCTSRQSMIVACIRHLHIASNCECPSIQQMAKSARAIIDDHVILRTVRNYDFREPEASPAIQYLANLFCISIRVSLNTSNDWQSVDCWDPDMQDQNYRSTPHEHLTNLPIEKYVDEANIDKITRTMCIRRGMIIDEVDHWIEMIYRSPKAEYMLVGSLYHAKKRFQCGYCGDYLSRKTKLASHLHTQHERTIEENDAELNGRVAILRTNPEDKYAECGESHYFVDRVLNHVYETGDFQHRTEIIEDISNTGFTEINGDDPGAIDCRETLKQ